MVFSKIFKKKNIPDELPSLVSDEIEETGAAVKDYLEEEEVKVKKEVIPEKTEEVILEKKEDVSEAVKREVKKLPQSSEKSFFNELQESLSSEIKNLDNLEDWYNKKFLKRDIVSDMREYWASQKTESIIEILGKNFKEKINEKTARLQELEKSWQDTYFELIEKEEEIKDQEKELKELLSEFVAICKRKQKESVKDETKKKPAKAKQTKKRK